MTGEGNRGGPLGSWRIHPTAILRRRRKEPFRHCLLFPPPGFSGEGRLGVIDGRRRAEFRATWENGRNLALTEEFKEDGGKLQLVALSYAVQSVVDLLNLAQFLHIEKNEAEAFAAPGVS